MIFCFLMKLRLDDDKMSDNFFEDTRILGIACTLKNYHFCWHIEKVLQIDFQTAPDLQIGMEKNRRSYSFTVYEFLHPISAKEHFLYSNKHDGELERGKKSIPALSAFPFNFNSLPWDISFPSLMVKC